jgi:hypothetical protein
MKNIIIGLVVLVAVSCALVATGVVVIHRKPDATNDTVTDTDIVDFTGLDTKKQLQSGVGSKSNPCKEVIVLQRLLNAHGARLDEDGVFGQDTFHALSKITNGKFQSISLENAYKVLKVELYKI